MITRRALIRGGAVIAAGTLVPNLAKAQSGTVKLLLVREAGYQNKCVSCIQGKVYGVPAAIELGSAEQVLGLLTPICDAVELSFEEGGSAPSSIAEGSYDANIRTDGTKKWMWTDGAVGSGSVILDRAWRLELSNVPKRSNIQFHYGKDASWSVGCIIVGHKLAQCTTKDQCRFPDSPVSAVKALRDYVEATATSSATPIRLRIASA